MTITLTLGTWIVPLAITLLSIICVVLVYIIEDVVLVYIFEDPDRVSFITFVGGLVATIISWIVWLIMTLMTK
jgi:hypothetical protein